MKVRKNEWKIKKDRKWGLININKGKINIKIEMFCGAGVKKQEQEGYQENKKIQNYIYKPSNKIGEGNFSQVFKGVDQNTGMHVAIKVVKYSSLTSKVAEQLLKNQVSILKELNHENVLKCHDVFSSKNNCYIVTDLYQGGDLEKVLFQNKYFHEKDITKIIYEVYKGLVYLNQHNIIHRDFKPANIFLTSSGVPKIADFGFAVKSSKPMKDINIGSPIYMSPEGLLLQEYGPKTEVWAFGVMIYQLLHGETPLSRCRDQKELKEKILLPPVYRDGISSQMRKMIDLCLTVDPKHRIQMKQIATTLYMSKLISQFSNEIPKDLTWTKTTAESLTQSALAFAQQIKTYEQGLALLQYCRLIHKTCQQTPSLVLSQWLLNLCWNLQKIKIHGGDPSRNENLIKTIHDYFIKYHKEHTDSHVNASCQDVIGQCQKLMGKIQNSINSSALKIKHHNLAMLLRQTQMLQKYGEANKLSTYAKATQIQKYLDSLKNAKSTGQSNQFIFNK